jgi:hypothetical protein
MRMGGNYLCWGFHIVLGFSYCVVCGIVIKVNEQDSVVISSQIASIFVIIRSIRTIRTAQSELTYSDFVPIRIYVFGSELINSDDWYIRTDRYPTLSSNYLP